MAEKFAGGHLRFLEGAWRDDNGDPVDCVKVVRCKDCKHFYDTHINPAHSCKRSGTQVWDVSFTPDDFCSYGGRRAEDE